MTTHLPRRRNAWFLNHMGAFGMTAAIGLFSIGGAVQQCAPPPAPVIVQVEGVQDAVVGTTNQHRAAAGLTGFTIDSRLTGAAQSHANDMAQRQRVTHEGTDGSNAGTRIERYGYGWTTWAENAAGGQPTAAEVMSAWMSSSGHRANILNANMANIGVAAAQDADGVTFWVMVLAA